MADEPPLGGKLDQRQTEGVSRSVRGRHEQRQLHAAYEALSDAEKKSLELERRIAELENFARTMIGANGVTVTGNVISGPRIPPPYKPPPPAEPFNPYEFGTTAEGSDDPENPTAPPALSDPMTDTGITGVQPLDIAGAETDGYKMQVMTRPKLSNTGSSAFDLLFFARDLTWMRDGRIYEGGPEFFVGAATVSGSGSGGGTV